MKCNNYNIGRWGENLTKEYLEKHGYKILFTNYRCCFGEIDIIAMDKNYLVFIEVKTRQTDFYPAHESITRNKKNHLRKTAEHFIYTKNYQNIDVRFDLVSIQDGKIDLIKNVFIFFN
jgi:putative endonuclease